MSNSPEKIGLTMWAPESFKRNPQTGTRVIDEPHSLARWAQHPIVTTDKTAGGGFSLALFREEVRRKAMVEGVYGLGLDVDDGSLTVDAAGALFVDYWTLAYSTHSSTDELPKTRVILLFDRPMTREEYELTWPVVALHMASLGVTLDRSTKDPSRLWYLPAVRPGARYDYAHHDGRAVAVAELVATARQLAAEAATEREARAREAASKASAKTGDAYVQAAVRRAADAVGSASVGDRHFQICREAYTLARFDLSADAIANALVPSFVAAAGEHRRREGEKAVSDCVAAARGGA